MLTFHTRFPDGDIAPAPVIFSCTAPPEADVEWIFGDGSRASGHQVKHHYHRPGEYRMQAKVHLTGWQPITCQQRVRVRSAGPERARVVLLNSGNVLEFSAAASVVYGPFHAGWELDGQPFTGSSELNAGRHRVQLTVQRTDGRPLKTQLSFEFGAVQLDCAFEEEVLALTNLARAQGWNDRLNRLGGPSLAPLQRNAKLALAARSQSAGMALGGYFSHTSRVDGSAPADRTLAAGYGRNTGENIAAGQLTPAHVVDGWIRSPGHRRNIMNPEYTELGVGFVSRPGTPYQRYWTQVFGTGERGNA